MSNNERPVHEIRIGKVKAAIWMNQTDNGPWFNVTFSRVYKTEEGWQSNSSFWRDELPLLAKVADQAHTWIYQQQASEREQAKAEQSPEPRSSRRNERATAGAK
jgi:hypothetical protein